MSLGRREAKPITSLLFVEISSGRGCGGLVNRSRRPPLAGVTQSRLWSAAALDRRTSGISASYGRRVEFDSHTGGRGEKRS